MIKYFSAIQASNGEGGFAFEKMPKSEIESTFDWLRGVVCMTSLVHMALFEGVESGDNSTTCAENHVT